MKTASLIKGSKQRGAWISLWGLLTHLQREGKVQFAHLSKSGTFQDILPLIKEPVAGVKGQ